MSVTDSGVADFVGRQITVGSTVVYPVRRGSSMWLSKLKVQQVETRGKPYLSGFNSDGRQIYVRNLSNVVVVASPETVTLAAAA